MAVLSSHSPVLEPASTVRRPVERSTLLLGPAVLSAAAVVSLLPGDPLASTGWAWAAVVALVLGVPHGAVDHLLDVRLASSPRRPLLVAAYLALAALGAAAVLLAPAPAFAAVLLLSVWHFGTGDVEALQEAGLARHTSSGSRLLHAAAAGAAAVLVPLTSPVGASTLRSLSADLAGTADALAAPAARICCLVLIAVAAAALLGSRSWRAAAELAVLTSAAAVLPPLLAFGLYFSCWHAARHTVRLAMVDGRVDPARLRRALRDGVPSLLVAVAAVAWLALGRSSAEVLWVGLAVVWGLTLPHTAVVTAADRRSRRQSSSAPGGGSDRSPNAACTSVSWRKVSQS